MLYFDKLQAGACYYPEHWDVSLWREDLARMQKAGLRFIRIAEFAWNKFENEEGVFTFDFFDSFLDIVEETDIKVIFCTPTATPPAWLTERYPETLQVDQDGLPYHHGCRRHYVYNSPVYREKTRLIVEKLAQHYAGRKCIIGWQIDNELNCMIDEFYSEGDHAAFREFLKEKYGTLDKVNDAWGTVFWNQTYTDWEQIYLPRHTPRNNTSNPHLKLDSLRFYSDSCISYCKLQYDILKKYLPQYVFITTQGLFPHVDYNRMCKETLDVFAYDSYPMFGLMEGADELKDRKWSMHLARVRGAGKQFGIMEQQSGPGGWVNFRFPPTPKPGQIRLWTYQSIANGADYMNYFRWRTCAFGTEIYWHGILNYDNQDNRRLEEIIQVAQEFRKIEDLPGMTYEADVAILYDYDNEWDGETDIWHGPIRRYSHKGLFKALQESHIPFDYVTVTEDLKAEDLSKYKVIFAPHLTIVTERTAALIKAYVNAGGIFVTGARTGYKDENGKCPMQIMPILMNDLFGAQIRDFTAVMPDDPTAYALWKDKELYMPMFHDLITPIEDTCETVAVYAGNYYKGTSAITKNHYGKGEAWYFGAAFNVDTVKILLKELPITSPVEEIVEVPEYCEIAIRRAEGRAYLSHNHHFKWWFVQALKRANYCKPKKAVLRALLLAAAYKRLLLSSFLDSSDCSSIYFFIASSVTLPIVAT